MQLSHLHILQGIDSKHISYTYTYIKAQILHTHISIIFTYLKAKHHWSLATELSVQLGPTPQQYVHCFMLTMPDTTKKNPHCHRP